MNKDAVRVNQVDLPTVFPSIRLFESSRAAWSIPCLIAAALVYWGCRIEFGMSLEEKTLDLTSAVSPFLPSVLGQIVSNTEMIAVEGFRRGLPTFMSLIVHLLCLGFGAVGIARFTALIINRNERCGVLRIARFCAGCWKSILVSTALAIGIGLAGLLFFRVTGLVARWYSGGSGDASVPNIIFWLASSLLLIGLYVLSIGWLLGISAIAIDRVDGAEALSRGLSYVLSRFRRTSSFLIVIGLIAKLAAIITWWGVTLSGKIALSSISEKPPGATAISAGFESFRTCSVESVQLSAVCCGVAIAYLILRQVIDNVDFREISDQQ